MKTLSSDKRVSRIAADAVFLAAALILSYVETLVLRAPLPLPGFKLGIANIAVVAVCYRYTVADAAAVSLGRILISFILFGSPTSLMFSFFGGMLSLAVLFLLKRDGISSRLSFIGISIICALAHNMGQFAAAMLLVGSAVISYAPILALLSILCGGVNGIILNLLPRELWRA